MRKFRFMAMLWLVLLLISSCKTNPAKPEQLPLPVFAPAAGAYFVGQHITIICAIAGASIRYTFDGSVPNLQSPLYLEPLSIPEVFFTGSLSGILKAKAFKDGWESSPVATAAYSTTYQQTAVKPLIMPDAIEIESGTMIKMTCDTPETQIRYTLDGTEPKTTSSLYIAPFHLLTEGYVTVKAKAFGVDCNPSASSASVYHVTANEMVFVQGGTFHNGTSEVTLSDFRLGKYEITQAEFLAVMGYDPASAYGDGGDLPVYEVSWMRVMEYCNKRSMLEGLAPCYSYLNYGSDPDDWPNNWDEANANHNNVACDWTATGYRLPTEMEWMYAAKGGHWSLGFAYAGSDNLADVGWYDLNSGSSAHAVGTQAPNELGLYDLSGNVREWVWDAWWGSYPSEPQFNPTGPVSGYTRINRSGSWFNAAQYCSPNARTSNNATYTGSTTGFRVCRRDSGL